MTVMTMLVRMAAAALAAAAAVGPAAAQQGPQEYGYHMWEGGWFGWFAGPVMMIVFIAVAVVLVVLIVRWLGGPGHGHLPHMHHHAGGRTALDILKERYARGEIDREEFEERRRTLGE